MYENRRAWLRMTGLSEGTVTSALTRNDGYDVIVTGIAVGADGVPVRDAKGRNVPTPEVLLDYSWHPFAGKPGSDPATWRKPKVINTNGLDSTASGRYQILRRYWLSYAKQLGLRDFSPASQDAYVLQQLQERGALAFIDGGYFESAVRAVSGLWASFPGRAYDGQAQHSLDRLRQMYLASGGHIHSN